jgi:hypothetical protein
MFLQNVDLLLISQTIKFIETTALRTSAHEREGAQIARVFEQIIEGRYLNERGNKNVIVSVTGSIRLILLRLINRRRMMGWNMTRIREKNKYLSLKNFHQRACRTQTAWGGKT